LEPSPMTNRCRVLIVDDDVDICVALDEVLRDLGYETHCCTSGTEALSVMDGSDFDVVVTDLRMPSLDGIGLCERIARNYNVPVIVMTAFGETQAAVDALRADAVDFMTKPFTSETVAKAVERAVSIGLGRQTVRKLTDSAAPQFEQVPVDDAEVSLDHLQREHMDKVLRAVRGNKAEAARVLGIDRATLYRRMKRFGWDRTG